MSDKSTTRNVDQLEEAVGGYLLYLKDPSSLIDQARIRELTGRLEASTSPLEQLRIASELHQAESVDVASVTTSFVRHAAAYAKREGLAPEAFLRLGVPRNVVQDAGLLASAGKQATKNKASAKSKAVPRVVGEPKERSPRTGREDVVAAVPSRSFTYRELEELSGASVVTVRRVVDDLLAAGAVVDIGIDPSYAGRGRAPRRFQPVSAKPAAAKPGPKPGNRTGSTPTAKKAVAKKSSKKR